MVNALEEMPKGGRLVIRIAKDVAPDKLNSDPWIRIDVSDSGPGIDEEEVDKIFEPFYTTKATGSGLGLAIVRGTVQRHGGLVRIHTAVGAGTTFCVFLPATV